MSHETDRILFAADMAGTVLFAIEGATGAIRYVEGIRAWLLVLLDAAGLSFFAIAGTEKALPYKMHPIIAIIPSAALREVQSAICFWREIPTVLRTDVYATAAPGQRSLVVSLASCCGLSACGCTWNLPRVIER